MRVHAFLAPMIVPALFLLIWELTARAIGNNIVLPLPGQVADLLMHPNENIISMGSLFSNVGISLARVLCGYAMAICLAVPLGVAMGYYSGLFTLFNAFLGMFRPIPPLAWVPLVLAWFGVASLSTLFNIPPEAPFTTI